MAGAFTDLTGLELFFLICAFLGGAMFLIRLVLQMVGGNSDVDTDIDVGHADVVHADSDVSFKLLTLQGLTAFFMMFGLVGFVLLRESKAGIAIAIAGALARTFRQAEQWTIQTQLVKKDLFISQFMQEGQERSRCL